MCGVWAVEQLEHIPEEAVDVLGRAIGMAGEAASPCALVNKDPARAARVLAEYGNGRSKNWICKEMGVDRSTLNRLLYQCKAHLGELRQIFGKEWALKTMVAQDVIGEALDEYAAEHKKADARDLKELSIMARNLNEMAMSSHGEATQIVESRKSYSIDEVRRMRDELLGKPVDIETEERKESNG